MSYYEWLPVKFRQLIDPLVERFGAFGQLLFECLHW
jgi:hypothetical protein